MADDETPTNPLAEWFAIVEQAKALGIDPYSNDFDDALPDHFPRGLHAEEAELPSRRWAAPDFAAHPLWKYQPGAFWLGYRLRAPVGRVDDRHILLVAGSRAGKGVSIILPNCLLWPGSLLAIDPKGELAAKTATHRAKSQRVVVLDPFNASKRGSTDGFNPLAEIDLAGREAADQAALIADGLIFHEGGGDRHWTDAAKQLVQAVILYVKLAVPEPHQHLGTVRDFLTLSDAATAPPPADADGKEPARDLGLFQALAKCTSDEFRELAELVSSVGLSMQGIPEKERGSIRSSAVTQTAFIESKAVRDTLRHSSFKLRDLKREKLTVYLCLPAKFMGTHSRWLRIVINMALAAMEDDSIKPPNPPLLMVLEEFNVLGHMASIATAAGQIAGYGVRLLTVLQDLTQLKQHYQNSWETFIGNSGLFIAFGNSDATTLEYISKKLGRISMPVVTENAQNIQAAMSGGSGVNTTIQTVPLLEPFEIEAAFARERGRLLVMFPGMAPLILQRCISHKDQKFAPLMTAVGH